MNALKVAIVVPYVPPTYIGGGETYIYYLSQELTKLGVNISLFTTKLPQDWKEWDWSHLDLHQCSSIFKVGNTPIMPTLLPRMLKSGSFELIHTAVPSGFACDVSSLVSSIRQVPVVLTYHCDLVNTTVLSKVYLSVLRYFTLKRTDRILPTTSSYAQTSLLLRSYMNKVKVVSMGTNLVDYHVRERDRQEIRKKHGINNNDKVILFVGGLGYFHKFKRVDLLIRAVEKVLREQYNVSLIIVGKGDLMHDLQTLCLELGLKKVIFTGYVPNDELPKYYSTADLFVLPSLTREEAFGIVLAEGASCGAIPICFDVPGPNEVCRNLGGFVVPLTGLIEAHDELAQVILQALTTDLTNQSKKCQNNAKQYAWSEVARKTIEVYRELVQK